MEQLTACYHVFLFLTGKLALIEISIIYTPVAGNNSNIVLLDQPLTDIGNTS